MNHSVYQIFFSISQIISDKIFLKKTAIRMNFLNSIIFKNDKFETEFEEEEVLFSQLIKIIN